VAVSDVDDAVVSDATDGACGAVAAAILEAVEAHPHRVAWEDGCESRTYLQIYRNLDDLDGFWFFNMEKEMCNPNVTHENRNWVKLK
jgi:hypothetical protein